MGNESKITTVIKLEGIRKVIARRMTQSKQEVPHVYYDIEVAMNSAKVVKDRMLLKQNQKISYNDIIVYSISRNLKKFPKFNAHIIEDELKIYKEINIGIAIGLDDGIIVPVIHDAGEMNLEEIAKATKKLIDQAKTKKLKPREYIGGNFTVSNLGMFGVTSFHAIINPPEVAILAVGIVIEKPFVKDGRIIPCLSTKLSLSADHRAIDGIEAAKFLYALKSTIENIENEPTL